MFIPVNMTGCVRLNVRTHMEIKDGDLYIALDIPLEIGWLKNREFNSS